MNVIYFSANEKVIFNNQELSKQELEKYLNNFSVEKETEVFVGYDKTMDFESYLQNRISAKKLNVKKLGLSINYAKEFVY